MQTTREGLKRIVADVTDLQVLAEAADGAEVMKRVRALDFDLLMLDLSMPGRRGMELIKQVKAEKPAVRILVLSMHQESQYAVRAIKSGASGDLTKESAPSQLVQAVRRIASGGAYISAEVAEQLALGAMPGGETARRELLSDREFDVMRRLAAGGSVSEVAAALNLSFKTVSTHKTNFLAKLGLSNQSQLVRYAFKHGLIDD